MKGHGWLHQYEQSVKLKRKKIPKGRFNSVLERAESQRRKRVGASDKENKGGKDGNEIISKSRKEVDDEDIVQQDNGDEMLEKEEAGLAGLQLELEQAKRDLEVDRQQRLRPRPATASTSLRTRRSRVSETVEKFHQAVGAGESVASQMLEAEAFIHAENSTLSGQVNAMSSAMQYCAQGGVTGTGPGEDVGALGGLWHSEHEVFPTTSPFLSVSGGIDGARPTGLAPRLSHHASSTDGGNVQRQRPFSAGALPPYRLRARPSSPSTTGKRSTAGIDVATSIVARMGGCMNENTSVARPRSGRIGSRVLTEPPVLKGPSISASIGTDLGANRKGTRGMASAPFPMPSVLDVRSVDPAPASSAANRLSEIHPATCTVIPRARIDPRSLVPVRRGERPTEGQLLIEREVRERKVMEARRRREDSRRRRLEQQAALSVAVGRVSVPDRGVSPTSFHPRSTPMSASQFDASTGGVAELDGVALLASVASNGTPQSGEGTGEMSETAVAAAASAATTTAATVNIFAGDEAYEAGLRAGGTFEMEGMGSAVMGPADVSNAVGSGLMVGFGEGSSYVEPCLFAQDTEIQWRLAVREVRSAGQAIPYREMGMLSRMSQPPPYASALVRYVACLMGIKDAPRAPYATLRVSTFKRIGALLNFLRQVDPVMLLSRRVRRARAICVQEVPHSMEMAASWRCPGAALLLRWVLAMERVLELRSICRRMSRNPLMAGHINMSPGVHPQSYLGTSTTAADIAGAGSDAESDPEHWRAYRAAGPWNPDYVYHAEVRQSKGTKMVERPLSSPAKSSRQTEYTSLGSEEMASPYKRPQSSVGRLEPSGAPHSHMPEHAQISSGSREDGGDRDHGEGDGDDEEYEDVFEDEGYEDDFD